MYYRSGTHVRCCIGARQTLCVHPLNGRIILREIMSCPTFWNCDVKSKIRLRQSMRIYLKNNPAKFLPNPVWNDWALGFFDVTQKSAAIWWVKAKRLPRAYAAAYVRSARCIRQFLIHSTFVLVKHVGYDASALSMIVRSTNKQHGYLVFSQFVSNRSVCSHMLDIAWMDI